MDFSTMTTFVPTCFLFGMIGLHALTETIKRYVRRPGSPLRLADFAYGCPVEGPSRERLLTVIIVLDTMIKGRGLNDQPMSDESIRDDVAAFASRQRDAAITLAMLLSMDDVKRVRPEAYWMLRAAVAKEQAQRICFAKNLEFNT